MLIVILILIMAFSRLLILINLSEILQLPITGINWSILLVMGLNLQHSCSNGDNFSKQLSDNHKITCWTGISDYFIVFFEISRLRKKNCAFLLDLRPISTKFNVLVNRWQNGWNCMYVSTSPNLCHRTTLLNTDVPNCHITLEFIILTQYLTTELSHIKLKYGLFNRAVSSTTNRLNSVFMNLWRKQWIYAQSVPRVHRHKRIDDGATGRQRHQRSTG